MTSDESWLVSHSYYFHIRGSNRLQCPLQTYQTLKNAYVWLALKSSMRLLQRQFPYYQVLEGPVVKEWLLGWHSYSTQMRQTCDHTLYCLVNKNLVHFAPSQSTRCPSIFEILIFWIYPSKPLILGRNDI